MLELAEAQRRILAAVQPLGAETVPLALAHGRVTATALASPLALPPFDNSAMDGFAVHAADVAGASAAQPVELRVLGTVAAGESFREAVAPGTCVRIFTGSPLPRAADAVVMQEDTRPDATRPELICVTEAVKPWENVRFAGEDLKSGAPVLGAGEWLTAGRLGLLAAVGQTDVSVGRQPRVGLVATGTELQEGGHALAAGQIYESNRAALAALVTRAGGQPQSFPLVRDTLPETTRMLGQAFAECDVVVSSGGVSVGEFDFVKRAFQELGGSLDFWRVAIKPGKPFVFGRCGAKLFFGLPGNPVSAFVTFLLLVRPALGRLAGATDLELPRQPGWLDEPLSNTGDRTHFVRVEVNPAGRVRSAGPQASHRLNSLARANGLVAVAPGEKLAKDVPVSVLRWD